MDGSIRPPTTAAGLASPTTVRRNPPRRARPPPTPLASAKSKPKPSTLSRLLNDEAPPPPPAPSSRFQEEERLKVFLRIRPLPDQERNLRKDVSRPMAAKDPRRKPKPAAAGGLCLVTTGPNSVALTVPQSKLLDSKRGRTEVFDGFSAVFPPDSSQFDIFAQVMDPLVDDFLGGKSSLLVAMGPTGSGKTHTIFGSPRNPGILPRTLRQIFSAENETMARSFSLSMFEILSEGKVERILDLLSDAKECVLQQSTIKGLQEVNITNFVDADSLVSHGMMKRSTAATNANSKSSRSQCIITIRAVHKHIDVESDHLPRSAVLTIADLAGAERERKTGNQGSRLFESNFINNTSMVFGLCLRSLLEHQKNQKRPLEKHFKNSMLTKYLRDYLEGRKKMTLVLNVKPGDDDYVDTSFLLRQASPYMKIKYTNLEDYSDLVSQKRSNVSLISQETKKKRKVHKAEVNMVERKENADTDEIVKVSKRDEAQHKFLNSELRRVSRSEEIMTNFAKALWTVLKQYKHKLLESENDTESMKELIREKDIQIMELKRELEVLNSCSCKNLPMAMETTSVQNDTVSSGEAAPSLVSQSNQPDISDGASDGCHNLPMATETTGVQDDTVSSGEAAPSLVSQSNQPDISDTATDGCHFVVELEAEEFTCHGPKYFPSYCELKGESTSHDTSAISPIHEQDHSSRDFKPEKSCSTGASDPTFDSESENTKEVQGVHTELDSSGNFAVETSSFSSTTPACIHSDDLSDQRLTEVMHPNCASSSPQVKSDTEDVSSFQSSSELQGMKAEEVQSESERCESTSVVEYSLLNHGCSGLPERTSPVKASMVVKDSEAEDVVNPGIPKKKMSRWRLQPIASMMLKELGGTGIDDMDKREDRSSKPSSGRSDVLIELLKKGRSP